MPVEEKVHVNALLGEVRELVEELDKLRKQADKLQGTINQLEGKQRVLYDKMYPLRIRKEKLVKAADALNDDWRDWPWVKEAGFAKDLPKS